MKLTLIVRYDLFVFGSKRSVLKSVQYQIYCRGHVKGKKVEKVDQAREQRFSVLHVYLVDHQETAPEVLVTFISCGWTINWLSLASFA